MKGFAAGIRLFTKAMSRNTVGFMGLILSLLIIGTAYIGPYVVKLDDEVKIDKVYSPPSGEHWLGTDHQGRDIFSQVIHGGRDVLQVAFLTSIIATSIAVTLGALSAFLGGKLDAGLLAFTDFYLTIPQFPLLAVLAAVVKLKSMVMLAVILGLLDWPTLMLAVRAQILSLKEREFVQAARGLDLGTTHIIIKEILPNMASYICITFIFGTLNAVYQQTGLVLLGLVPFSGTNWGVMISFAWVRGAIFFKDSIWYILSPITAIALLNLSMVWMTRSLDELFNPRLRTGE